MCDNIGVNSKNLVRDLDQLISDHNIWNKIMDIKTQRENLVDEFKKFNELLENIVNKIDNYSYINMIVVHIRVKYQISLFLIVF